MQLVKVTPVGLEVAEIVTIPENPLRLVTVTEVVPVAPELKSAGLVADTLKPGITVKVNVAVVWWDAVPGDPIPVIVTGKLPAEEDVQVNIALLVPFAVSPIMLEGLNGWHERPDGTMSVRDTVPAKLKVLVNVMVDVSDDP